MHEQEFEDRIRAGRPHKESSRVWFQKNLRQQLVARHEEAYTKRVQQKSTFFSWRLLFLGSTLVVGFGFSLASYMYTFPREAMVPLAAHQPFRDVSSLGDLSRVKVSVGEFGGDAPDDSGVLALPTYVFPDTLPSLSDTGYVYQPVVPLDVKEAGARLPHQAPFGYGFHIDSNYNRFSIFRNEDFSSSVNEEGLFTEQTLPSSEEVISAATLAAEIFNVHEELARFGAPAVSFSDFYMAWVTYPLYLDGTVVQDPFFNRPFGAMVNVNMNSLQIPGQIVGIDIPIYSLIERAEYSLVTEKEKVLQRLQDMGYAGRVVLAADVGAEHVRWLGAPEQVLAVFIAKDGHDIFGPAWRFPVLGDVPHGEPHYLYVPLVGRDDE